LHLPNLHICLTSRPEADIQASLSSLAPHTISLHKESGRKMDKVNCIRSVLQSDQNIRKRRAGNKQPKRAEGM
jgi:hypothetical protein